VQTPTRGRRRPRPILSLLAAGLLAAAFAACSGSAPAPSVPSLPSASGSPGASAAASPGARASIDPQDAMLAYAQCMRQNGIDFPDPQPASGWGGAIVALPGDFNSPKYQAADTACKALLPGGGIANLPVDPHFQDQMLAYAKCMRDHGIDFPDPKFDTSGGGMSAVNIGGNVDPGAPAFQAADKACGANLPGGGSTTVTIGGSGTGPAGAPVTKP
jgi:hypothetical protein